MSATAQPNAMTLQQLSDLLSPRAADLLPATRSLLDALNAMQAEGYEVGQPHPLPLKQPRPGHAAWGVPITTPEGFAGVMQFFVPINNTSRSSK
jgi:hypothetical protein